MHISNCNLYFIEDGMMCVATVANEAVWKEGVFGRGDDYDDPSSQTFEKVFHGFIQVERFKDLGKLNFPIVVRF